VTRDPDFTPSGPRVALFGAGGLVGEFLLAGLEERGFPVAELRLYGSERSRGKSLAFRGRRIPLEAFAARETPRVDLAFLALPTEHARELAPRLAERGALVIDKSSAFRLAPEVPLWVPELRETPPPRAGIVASPNCTTTVLVLALEPLRRAAGLLRVTVTSLQSASGAGRAGLAELRHPTGAGEVFAEPLAGNVVPLCDALDEEGVSGEEHKLVRETRRLLGLPDLVVEATATRVPVEVGHTLAVVVELERELPAARARAAWDAFPGLESAHEVPTPRAAAGRDPVLVGRLRALGPRRLAFVAVGDNLRKGAATNALQIAERWWAAYGPGAGPRGS